MRPKKKSRLTSAVASCLLVLCIAQLTVLTSAIAQSAPEQSDEFLAKPNLARIYLMMDIRYKKFVTPFEIKSGDKLLAEITRQQYSYIDVLPGTYPFRISWSYLNHWETITEELFTEFDLSLSADSVVLLLCEHGKVGFRSIRMTPDPVLRKTAEACSNGANLNESGVSACVLAHEKPLKFRDYDSYADSPSGTCKLINDKTSFAGFERVEPVISPYLSNQDSAYQLALDTNSSKGYGEFLQAWPQSPQRSEIEALIKTMSAAENASVFENKIDAALKRDSVLPPQAQHDKYMIALTGYLKQQDFESTLFYFELLNRLDVELSPSLNHFWGEALLRTGQREASLQKLYEYIKVTGSTGTYYRDALALINEAEQF